MNWGGVRHGRQLALAYLITFPGMVAGLALVLGAQATAHEQLSIPGGVLFVGSQLLITALSFVLRDAAPVRADGRRRDRGAVAWNRLSSGLELPAAWRVARSGEGDLSGS